MKKIVALAVILIVLIRIIDTQHNITCNNCQTYTLFRGVNKFLHLLSHFLTDLVEILYMKSPHNVAGIFNFRENWCIGGQTSHNSVKDYLTLLHIYCTIWVKFCVCISHEMLLDTQDFRKNRRRRFCTSRKDMNGIAF